jgi:hypothetical protein
MIQCLVCVGPLYQMSNAMRIVMLILGLKSTTGLGKGVSQHCDTTFKMSRIGPVVLLLGSFVYGPEKAPHELMTLGPDYRDSLARVPRGFVDVNVNARLPLRLVEYLRQEGSCAARGTATDRRNPLR